MQETQSRWINTGFWYLPTQTTWAKTHATVPTPLHLGVRNYRIFYSSRDEESRNRVGWVDIEVGDKPKVISECTDPALDIGQPGHFDCDGVYGTCAIRRGSQILLYYAGWNAGLRGYFYSSIGVAVSSDCGKTFQRPATYPILGRDRVDPWACMAPYVLQIGPQLWRMWYSSGIELLPQPGGGIKSRYDVKTATSIDGFTWTKTGKTAIPLGDADTNIARAWVLPEGRRFRAWYPYVSARRGEYRIGYAVSEDGFAFSRDDGSSQTDINRYIGALPQTMKAICYPSVFTNDGREYMIFNGDGFGRTGFGIAVRAET